MRSHARELELIKYLLQSVKNVFSSGLDFNEVHAPEESRINAFWLWFQESWIKLYGSSFPTVALINGHAPGMRIFQSE